MDISAARNQGAQDRSYGIQCLLCKFPAFQSKLGLEEHLKSHHKLESEQLKAFVDNNYERFKNDDVNMEESRPTVHTLTSIKDLPDVQLAEEIGVRLDRSEFSGDTARLFDWVQQHSSKISELWLNPSKSWDRLLSPDLQFPRLKIVKLQIEGLGGDYIKKLIDKFWPQIEELCLNQELNTSGSGSIKYTDVVFSHREKFPRLKILKISVEEDTKVPRITDILENHSETLVDLNLTGVDLENNRLMAKRLKGLLHLEMSRCTLSMSQFKNLIRDSAEVVQSIILREVLVDNDTQMFFALPSLKEFKVEVVNVIGYITCKMFAELLTTLELKNMKLVPIHKFDRVFPVLKRATLISCDGSLKIFLKRCPRLETLILEDTPVYEEIVSRNLKHISITSVKGGPFLQKLIRSCRSNLQVLEVLQTRGMCGEDILGKFDHDFPAMRALRLEDCEGNLHKLTDKCPNLETLVLSDTHVYDEMEAANLKHLVLEDQGSCGVVEMINRSKSTLQTLALGEPETGPSSSYDEEEDGDDGAGHCDVSDFKHVDGRLTNLKKFCACPAPSKADRKWLKESFLPRDVETCYKNALPIQLVWEKFLETGEWCFQEFCFM